MDFGSLEIWCLMVLETLRVIIEEFLGLYITI